MIIVEFFLNFLKVFYHQVKLSYVRASWRALNKHNYTVIDNIFSFDNITVGKSTYGIITVYRWGSANEGLHIGSFCSIASGVKFLLGGNHDTDTISTYPFHYFYKNRKNVAVSKGPIIVQDDVWIGTDVTILSGITIGKGAVIAAGSLVTKNVEPYAIIGGNPARVLKYRFSPIEIEIIDNIDYSKLDDEKITRNLNVFAERLGGKDLSHINNLLKKID